jgi:hypothetical protein
MTLRNELGGDVQDVFEQVNDLLDSEDALIVLFDGRRIVSYTHGFAASPCQLELVSVEIERSVRNAVGVQSTTNRRDRRNREESNARTPFLRAILHRGIPASSAHVLLVTSLEGPHLPRMLRGLCPWQMSSTCIDPLMGIDHFFRQSCLCLERPGSPCLWASRSC